VGGVNKPPKTSNMSFNANPDTIDFRNDDDAEDIIAVHHSSRYELLGTVNERIPYHTADPRFTDGLELTYGPSRYEFDDSVEIVDIIKLGVTGSTWKGANGTFYPLQILLHSGEGDDTDTVQISRGGGGGPTGDARSLTATYLGSRIVLKKYKITGLSARLSSGKNFLKVKPVLPPKGIRCICGTKVFPR